MRVHTRCCLGFLVLAAATVVVAQWSPGHAEGLRFGGGGGWGRSDPGRDRPDGGGGQRPPWGQPGVWVEPNINIYTQPPQVAPGPETVPAVLAACGDRGLIVDCLRGTYSSVSIRRLEACLGTEVLPANPVDVRGCLAAGNW